MQYLLPTITYACQIWGTVANEHINKLQPMQNQALRTILNAPFYIPRIVLHRELKMPSICSRNRAFSTSFCAQIALHHNNTIMQQADYNRTGNYRLPLQSINLPIHYN
ncbi:hypothetical protein TNCV_3359291 [Trichonephila clavipes]|nr:hypothetical protein TNCV_3359291 [Trichonephila clavipes]